MTDDYLAEIEKSFLGDSAQVILDQQQRTNPMISEFQFEREVLDILTNPFSREGLAEYMKYVGELTKPLNVVDNQNPNLIILTVPALVQAPTPTTATSDGYTMDHYFQAVQREREMGLGNIEKRISETLLKMTHFPDYIQTVVFPIQDILHRYNRQMVELPGLRQYRRQQTSPTSGQPSTFEDEYED